MVASGIATQLKVPQITTVIPTFRRPALLRRSIQSVLNQSFGDFEVHVYDNASGDETPQVVCAIASKDPRVKYFCHEHNIGLIENFAFGMSRVRTPFFNLLSDDDIVLPGFFETAVRALARYEKAMAFIGGLVEADPSARVLRVRFRSWRPGLLYPSESLTTTARTGIGTWTSMLFRRRILSATESLNAKFGLAADIEFELRTLASHPVVIDTTPFAVFFMYPSSASAKDPVPELAASLLGTLNELRAGGHDVPASALKKLESQFRKFIFGKARFAAAAGKNEEALLAARMLRDGFGATHLAALVRLMSSSSLAGQLARASFRALRGLAGIPRRVSQTHRFGHVREPLMLYLKELQTAAASAPSNKTP